MTALASADGRAESRRAGAGSSCSLGRALKRLVLLLVVSTALVACSTAPTPPASPPPPAPPMPTAFSTPEPKPAPSCGGGLQALIDGAPAGSVLHLPDCLYASGATIRKPLTLVGGAIAPSRASGALLVTSSGVTIDGLHVYGPQAATYNWYEVGIEALGTVNNPIHDLVIRNCEIGDLGYGGVRLQYVQDFTVTQNLIYDGVYAGILLLSGQHGQLSGNTILRIGVRGAAANENNAYGIALTRWPNSLAADPRSADIVVWGNTVADVPAWHAFDTHGGSQITWSKNIALGSRSGFFITGSSSPTGAVRALDNQVDGNTVFAPANADHYAITSVYSTGGSVRDNALVGWPSGHEVLTTSSGEPEATAANLLVEGNLFIP